MADKLHHLENHRFKLSTIVERSPLYRFLDQSRAALLKLQPAWESWFTQRLPQLNESAAHLSGFDTSTQTITVVANNSSTAALIKHQKSSLSDALNANGSLQIKHINIRIDLVSTSAAAKVRDRLSDDPDNKNNSNAPKPKAPDTTAIESLQHLQSSVSNPDLADTLGDLAETLKDFASTSIKNKK